MRYAELQVTSHFSFLRGASSAQELFETARTLGIDAIGVVDRNSLAGVVRALEALRGTGLRLVVGCRLDLADGMSVLVYPTDSAAYSRLTRLGGLLFEDAVVSAGSGRRDSRACIRRGSPSDHHLCGRPLRRGSAPALPKPLLFDQ
jgi:hypothetical protein